MRFVACTSAPSLEAMMETAFSVLFMLAFALPPAVLAAMVVTLAVARVGTWMRESSRRPALVRH